MEFFFLIFTFFLTTQASMRYFPMPNESWKRPDENTKEFPKYYDRFPEELILNDTERKIFENLPDKEVQKIINMRRERRTSIYTR